VRRRLLVFTFYWLCIVAPNVAVYSQTQPTAQPSVKNPAATLPGNPNVDAIQKEIAAFVVAFNSRDAKTVAAFWAADGEYVDEAGRAFVGRGAIEAYYTELLKGAPEGKLALMSDSIRLLSDSVAVEDGHAVLEPSPAGASGINKYTAIYTKIGGRWLLASVRDSYVDTSSSSADLADLEWLIGDWTAEENGATTDSTCRWVANKKFVERSYTTTMVDGSVTTGLQIIGWNSQSNHVQSWNFSADGGNAIGVWSGIEGGWIAKVSGTTGNGLSTTAVNMLKRLDGNAYVWQSMDRTIGELRLPDTNEVVIRRVKSKK
jgi:uncharacterized protein (TIGR02246 family)